MSNIYKVREGFTLVELLVVIAASIILAGFLIPNIDNPSRSAAATGVANKARMVVQFIVSENIEREALSKEPIWPEYVGLDGKGGGSTANDYCAYLVEVGTGNIKPAMFAGGGVASVEDATELKSRGNAWCIFWGGAVGQTNAYITAGNPPFMVSRNFKRISVTADDVLSMDDFDPNAKPFGREFVVAVFRDNTVLVSKCRNVANKEKSRFFFNYAPSGVEIAIARTADEK